MFLYFTCWLVLVRTRVLVFLSSLGQRSRLDGSLVINYVNSIKPESTYPIPIHEVTSWSCQFSHFCKVNLFNRLLVHINHTSIKNPFRQKAPSEGVRILRVLNNLWNGSLVDGTTQLYKVWALWFQTRFLTNAFQKTTFFWPCDVQNQQHMRLNNDHLCNVWSKAKQHFYRCSSNTTKTTSNSNACV